MVVLFVKLIQLNLVEKVMSFDKKWVHVHCACVPVRPNLRIVFAYNAGHAFYKHFDQTCFQFLILLITSWLKYLQQLYFLYICC